MKDYFAMVNRAMADCHRCRPLTPTAREAHRRRSLEQILRTQTRILEPLPAHVWPNETTPI